MFTSRLLSLCLLTLIITLFPHAGNVFALEPNKAISQYVHRSWETKDGLPINTVNFITQGEDGYLWMATYEGVVRFDGKRFVEFNKQNVSALKTNQIYVNTAVSDGSVWFGTQGYGAVRLQNGNYQSFTTENGLAGDDVTAIFETRDGSVWFGTLKNGLSRYKDGTFTNYTNDELAQATVWNFAETPDGSLWIGTNRLPLRFQNGEFKVYTASDGLTIKSSLAMNVDKEGKLWIGGTGGLNVWQNENFVDYSKNVGLDGGVVMAVYSDRDANLWIGTSDKGVIRYRDGKTDRFQKSNGLSSDAVLNFYEDREGTLWIATESGGLNQLFNGSVTAVTTSEGLADNSLGGLIESRAGEMWISHNKGLSRFVEGKLTNLSVKDGLPEGAGWVLGAASDGSVWISTLDQGLARFANGKFQVFGANSGIPEHNANAIFEDSKGNLWVATAGGLFCRNGEEKKLFTKRDGLSDDIVQTLLESKNGLLWIGTINGLQSFDGEKFTTYTIENGLPDNKIRALHEDKSGSLWVATNGGLARISSDGRIVSFTVQNGLYNNVAHAVLSDNQNNLWMSSNTGIFRVNKSDLERFAKGEIEKFETVVYGVADGMKTREANGGTGISPAGWQSQDGKLWFSSEGGAVVIDPNNLVENAIAPEVIIEEVLFNEKPQPRAEKLTVNAGTNRLDFRFTAPSFRAPEKVKIQYQLMGYDTDWHFAPTGERQISYTNLPPGDYTFRVKAANEDGVWNETGASFAMYVAPRFYQTRWFYALCALGVVGTVFLVYSLRLRQIKQRFSLVLEERTRIAREIHDTLAQNFLATSLQLEAAEEMLKGDGDPALKKHLGQARTLAREGLREARNSISSLRHQKAVEEKSLVVDLEKFAHQTVAAANLNLMFKIKGKPRKYSELIEHNFFRIGQEAIVNAIKHSSAQNITVELTFDVKNLRLRVEDDGRGFDKQIVSKISINNGNGTSYGLLGLKERAKIIGAQFEVETEEGKGTILTVTFKN